MTLVALDIAVFLAYLVSFVLSIASAERLITLEHDTAPEAWEADGRPAGYFSGIGDGSLVGGLVNRNVMLLNAIVTTPGWVHPDSEAAIVHRRFRVVSVVSLALLVCWFGLTVWIGFR